MDNETLQQIYKIKNHPSIVGQIAIMPDAHAGAGCVIGTTGTFGDSLVVNFIGVDIGCGVLGCNIGSVDIDFEKFDTQLKKQIPLGMKHRLPRSGENIAAEHNSQKILNEAIKVQESIDRRKIPAECQIGTLGGGNHFIEVGVDSEGDKWVFIHSGSRNFGLTVAQYYQNMAPKNQGVPKGMEYLSMDEGGEDYLRDMKVAQRFAKANRFTMLDIILNALDVQKRDIRYHVDTVHNYIAEDGYFRKGAISAYSGEKVLIPLNMRDGTVIGTGKGNSDYNYSAPHGAGRQFGRGEMKRMLSSGKVSVEAFQNEMKGIFTTTANAGTIDESPFAYKPFGMIQKYLEETVDIKTIVKPVYNLKGTE